MSGRLVWIEEIEIGLSDEALAGLIRSRYGSHPADPAEAVRDALIQSTDLPADERRLAIAVVLAALGVPDTKKSHAE